jgi:hypothetical protein
MSQFSRRLLSVLAGFRVSPVGNSDAPDPADAQYTVLVADPAPLPDAMSDSLWPARHWRRNAHTRTVDE